MTVTVNQHGVFKMRRTRLNVVPPTSKEVALGQVIDGDKVMSLPTQVKHTIGPDGDLVPQHESRTQRVRRLQEEARALAQEQISEFETLLDATAKMAMEIAEGGDVYAVGAREICRRLADDLPRALQTLQALGLKNSDFAASLRRSK